MDLTARGRKIGSESFGEIQWLLQTKVDVKLEQLNYNNSSTTLDRLLQGASALKEFTTFL
jgi:hypothetical protein